jgi:hypothetical protein
MLPTILQVDGSAEHTPLAQVGVLPLQVFPQKPQWELLEERLVSHPLLALLSQFP